LRIVVIRMTTTTGNIMKYVWNSPLESMYGFLDNNPIIIALLMIFLNISTKYIFKDVPVSWEKMGENQWFRYFVVFAISYVGIRDFSTSVLMVVIFAIVFKFLLNEDSDYYIFDDKEQMQQIKHDIKDKEKRITAKIHPVVAEEVIQNKK